MTSIWVWLWRVLSLAMVWPSIGHLPALFSFWFRLATISPWLGICSHSLQHWLGYFGNQAKFYLAAFQLQNCYPDAMAMSLELGCSVSEPDAPKYQSVRSAVDGLSLALVGPAGQSSKGQSCCLPLATHCRPHLIIVSLSLGCLISKLDERTSTT